MTESSPSSIVVTIDGPAGSGKSSAARALAERLNYEFLDTGAMYRAVALSCLKNEIAPEDEEAVATLTRSLEIKFQDGRLLVNDQQVTDDIRSSAVSSAASVVAQHSSVREILVDLQRASASSSPTVTEGRDQGTVVFPHALCKFFLTARPEVRAQRRYDETPKNGDRPAFAELVREIRERDERDANRSVAPLKPADDAISIDTSDSALKEVVSSMENIVRDKIKDRV